ncbi:hypothetical protein FQZ97_972090 [compost metagenome]
MAHHFKGLRPGAQGAVVVFEDGAKKDRRELLQRQGRIETIVAATALLEILVDETGRVFTPYWRDDVETRLHHGLPVGPEGFRVGHCHPAGIDKIIPAS